MKNSTLPGITQFRLDDRVAIITGGSKGLGFAMAAGLASAGAKVVLVSRHADEASEAAQSIAAQYGTTAIGYAADVTIESDCAMMAEHCIREFGRVDILINNAGINLRGPIDSLSLEEFQRVMNTNVTGCWLAARAVVPPMKKAGWGRIINLASTLGVVGLENRTPYASSKGAVVQMTRALSLELALNGINVNAICPGPFLTEMNEPIADSEEARINIIGATALKRWGKLEEIQGAAIFLASDASSYVTGSLLMVDGGWTTR